MASQLSFSCQLDPDASLATCKAVADCEANTVYSTALDK